MKTEIELDSHASLVAVVDAGAATRDAEALRAAVETGGALLVEAEEAQLDWFHVYLDEPVPEAVEKVCSRRGGPFLLRVPSGRLSLCGLGTDAAGEAPQVHTIEVPPGDYAVSLFDGTDKDLPALRAAEQALVDPADWRLYHRVHDMAAVGCLGFAAGMVFVLVPYTRRELWFLLPLFLLPAAGYTLLKRLPGYRRVDDRLTEFERGLPQIALVLERVESTAGLAGGSYRC